jgi:hypothetical protein
LHNGTHNSVHYATGSEEERDCPPTICETSQSDTSQRTVCVPVLSNSRHRS